MLLDNLYTGFNISTNITTAPQYHALAGFTHADVERGLDELLRSEPDLANDERIGRRAELMILITSAVLSGIFQVLSEKEVAQGFCDLFWTPRYDNTTVKYSWMLELKYLHAGTTEKAIEKAFADAEAQLDKYSRDTTLVPLLTKQHAFKAAT